MKINTRFFFLFLLSSLNLFGKNVDVLVDYTMNKNRLDQLKEKCSIAFSKNTVVHIIYIGNGKIFSESDKYDPFKVSCGFDECEKIDEYLNYKLPEKPFVCVIRELSKCNRLQDSLYFEDLNKSQKKNLKKSDNILLIDLKGVEIQPLPSISITPNEAEINAGEEILFNAQISNTSLKGTLEWFENGIKVESRVLKYSTMPENDVQIICKWNFEDCTVESNEVNINVKRCQSAIPYSLFFDNSTIYSRNINNSNKIYIYPMNDSNGSRVLLIKQDCFFSEFEMEILDKNDILLGKKIFQINNKSSNQILQFLSIRDNSILAVDVQDLIDPFKEQFIYIRIIPTKIPMLEQNIPKYEVFFTSCSPNE